jgi:hypothetical protein
VNLFDGAETERERTVLACRQIIWQRAARNK